MRVIPIDARAIEAYRSILLRDARRKLRGALRAKVGAADVVQEAFLVAIRRLDRFGGRAGDELLAWLRTILDHRISHAARRFRSTAKRRIDREVPIDAAEGMIPARDALAIDEPSPRAGVILREEARLLADAMGRLDDDDRALIGWRHGEGRSFREIGLRLGCSNVTAKARYVRALTRLRESLAEGGLAE